MQTFAEMCGPGKKSQDAMVNFIPQGRAHQFSVKPTGTARKGWLPLSDMATYLDSLLSKLISKHLFGT